GSCQGRWAPRLCWLRHGRLPARPGQEAQWLPATWPGQEAVQYRPALAAGLRPPLELQPDPVRYAHAVRLPARLQLLLRRRVCLSRRPGDDADLAGRQRDIEVGKAVRQSRAAPENRGCPLL